MSDNGPIANGRVRRVEPERWVAMKGKRLLDTTEIHGIIADAFSTRGTGKRWIRIKTPSGRIFRYELSEFPISADTTGNQVAALAASIVSTKYRYCQWDKEHPDANVEREIAEGIKTQIMQFVAEMHRQRGPLNS
jgi:hypothetical protein